MPNFTPFDCELQQIDERKLDILIEKKIAESWFIEYKELLITDSKKLAKSISAFANAEGGWYFMGVKSDSKTNVATEINGVDTSLENDLADRLSKIIVGNISPAPNFEINFVELTSGKEVVIIKVEEGIQPPYITSSGTIHQREHNANNPVRDRYLIERMYDKAKNNNEIIERFTSLEYGATKGQDDSDQGFLELYLFPSPYNSFSFKEYFKADFFDKISEAFFNSMEFTVEFDDQKYSANLNLSFNAIYTSHDSLVIRPINDENIIFKGTTIELFRNGNMKLLLPLVTFKLKNSPQRYENSKLLEYLLDRFCPFKEKNENNYDPLDHSINSSSQTNERIDSEFSEWFQLIDGHELMLSLFYVIDTYRDVLANNNYSQENSLGFRARIDNSWRKMMFFDNLEYLEAIKKYNVPVTPKIEIEIPSFRNGHYYIIKNQEFCSLIIIKSLLTGLGIPKNDTIDYTDILKTAIENLKKR